MKQITYGNKTYQTPENHYEMPQTRLVEINKYIVAVEWGHTPDDLQRNIEGYIQGFNNSRMADCMEYLINLKHNLGNLNTGFDPFEHMHALLMFDEKEMQKPGAYDWVQSTYLEEKVKEIRDSGATKKDFATVNHFFFLHSYPDYSLGSLKVLRLLQEYLKAWYIFENVTQSVKQTTSSQKEGESSSSTES